jgi:hypothetical protein
MEKTMSITREDIIAKLKEGFVSIEFEKADGTMRPMLATLSESVLPPQPPTETITEEEKKKRADTALAVWDMDVASWRSFRWDKLRYFDGVDLPNGVQ